MGAGGLASKGMVIMNEGHLAIGVLLATIGSIVVMVWYRDLIFGSPIKNRPTPRRTVQKPRSKRSDRSNDLNGRSPQQNAEIPSVQRSNVQVERSEIPEPLPADVSETVLTLTTKELQQLTEAVRFHQAGQSKQSSCEAAFGCSKGASKDWKRASLLFDLATGKGMPNAE